MCCFVFFFKQNTAYEMRISDWSSDVCSSDLELATPPVRPSHPSAPARGPLAMAKILVGYERGEGLGHYRRLAPVAEALAAEGHQVVFFMRNLWDCRAQLPRSPLPFIQSPDLVPPPPAERGPKSSGASTAITSEKRRLGKRG